MGLKNKKNLVEKLNNLNLSGEEYKSLFQMWRTRKEKFCYDDLVDCVQTIINDRFKLED